LLPLALNNLKVTNLCYAEINEYSFGVGRTQHCLAMCCANEPAKSNNFLRKSHEEICF